MYNYDWIRIKLFFDKNIQDKVNENGLMNRANYSTISIILQFKSKSQTFRF